MVLWMGRPSKPMSSNFSRRACLPVTLSSWTTCRAIRSRVYAKLSPRRGPTSAISRLTAQISILSSSSLPSSRRCSGRRPRELSMTCSRQSPMLSPSSLHRNAPTMSQTAAIATQPENALDEPALLDRRFDKGSKERVGFEGARLELGMILDSDKPWMVRNFDRLGQESIGRHPGKAQADRFKALFVVGVDLITVAVALGDPHRAVDFRDLAAGRQNRLISA